MIQHADYAQAIEDLKATEFRRFTDNFICMISMTPEGEEPLDWFDPEWVSISHNAACLARVAKQGGLKGLVFDAEEYGHSLIWSYNPRGAGTGKSSDEYLKKVRERGQEFIRAVNQEYPDITILALGGYEWPYRSYGKPAVAGEKDYRLLAAFYDGICEAATPETVLVDGYEQGYSRFGLINSKAYVDARKFVMVTCKNAVSQDTAAFDKHVQMGFPVWPDYWDGERLPFFKDHPSRNPFTPGMFRTSLANALANTDKYVWIYNQGMGWWTGDAPGAYVDALEFARTGPGKKKYPDEFKAPCPALDLPLSGWKFSVDASAVGEKEGWQNPVFDDSSWQPFTMAESESGQQHYSGYGWYRLKFTAPAAVPSARYYIASDMVGKDVSMWVNGILVGRSSLDQNAAGSRCVSFEVTSAIKCGQENRLAIRILSGGTLCGLVKHVSQDLVVWSQ
jgi:hypothetical protein